MAFYQDEAQVLLPLESVLEIEHIYARNRYDKEHSLTNPRNVEALGNKALLEKRINIRASDYRFDDKKKYYVGFENARKQMKPPAVRSIGFALFTNCHHANAMFNITKLQKLLLPLLT